MVKKVLLACVAVLFFPGRSSQPFFALLVITAYVVGTIKAQPYLLHNDDVSASFANVGLWLTVLYSLLSQTNALTAEDTVADSAAGILLVIVQVSAPLLFFATQLSELASGVWSMVWQRFLAGKLTALTGQPAYGAVPNVSTEIDTEAVEVCPTRHFLYAVNCMCVCVHPQRGNFGGCCPSSCARCRDSPSSRRGTRCRLLCTKGDGRSDTLRPSGSQRQQLLGICTRPATALRHL
jgi:hypothetical protein